MTILEFLHDGVVQAAMGAIATFIAMKVWPLIATKIIPERIKMDQQNRELHVKDLEHQREVQELRQREQDTERKEETDFRHKIELERIESAHETKDAIKSISASISIMGAANAQTNERMAAILANQALIMAQNQAVFGVLTDAVGDIRESLALKEGIQVGRHLPRTGPLQDDKKAKE